MSGEERRTAIIEILSQRTTPISGAELAKQLHVSRQIIVQDMALLRSANQTIISTHRGYLYPAGGESTHSRIFKCCHSDEQTEAELNCIVDQGGIVENVFVHHKVYGRMEAPLNIRSRRDVHAFLESIRSGKSTLLMNITSNYHYHKITASEPSILNAIEQELIKYNFLVPQKDA